MKFLNKKQRWSILIPIGILVIGSTVFLSRQLLPKPISASDCIIVTVEQGNVYQAFVASGTVEAENEVLIRCPYQSIVKLIIKEPGSRVQKGDVILVLEDLPIKDEIDKINDQLELKRNTLEKNKLSEFGITVDLNYSEEVKKLTITSLKSQLADEEQLLEVGGISPAKIEKTKQEIALAEKDLVMLKQKNAIRLKQLKAEEQGLVLGINIQEKELADKVRVLSMMHITAPSGGIILSIANKVGEKVNTDNVLIRMSDLSTFKISGSVDDKLADYIKTGRKVYAVIDSLRLPGLIGNVTPMIENSKIQFNVHLEEKSHPKLISNQKITLWVVGVETENTTRIKNLNLFDKEVPNVLYVLNNGEAIRREITLGIKNPDYIQVLSGVEAGEKIIIPKRGISAFRNANSIVINN
jgi:HlyD family secretion protein